MLYKRQTLSFNRFLYEGLKSKNLKNR